MIVIRRILFAQCAAVLATAFALNLATPENAFAASGTKVGNGDDGADLEALSVIKSGPIVDARARAVELLRRLNVAGVPGLGTLLPELQRTDLLLAQQDAHPTGEQLDSIEVSDDKKLVYARTFAEPYAATRFFPAALRLNSDQLIALQIHEALHRSIPSDVRTNEDIVMHLTMAITSPGATFDRVRRVAGLYIRPELAFVQPNESPQAAGAGTSISKQIPIPSKSKTEIGYQFDSFTGGRYGFAGRGIMHGAEVKSSLGGFHLLGSVPIEPVFRARVKLSEQSATMPLMGPSSFDLIGKLQISDDTTIGPFVRFTAKSLDQNSGNANERDLLTFGGFYRVDSEQTYFDTAAFFSLPSTSEANGFTVSYKSAFSVAVHSGHKWGRFSLGGLAELHVSGGRDVKTPNGDDPYGSGYGYGMNSTAINPDARLNDSVRIFVAGPEIAWTAHRFQIKGYCKWIMNNTPALLDDLGDVVDRGSGDGGLGTSISMNF